MISAAAEPTRRESLMACRGVRDLGGGVGNGRYDPGMNRRGLSWEGFVFVLWKRVTGEEEGERTR